MLKQGFLRHLSAISGAEFLLGEPMTNHTSFKIGGPADILVMPESTRALAEIISVCRVHNMPFCVIGAGSNLLVSDKGIRGAVIKLTKPYCDISADGETITALSGISLAALSKFALSHCLSGLEFASGIPGLLGGAVYMNAGAYGGEMKDVVMSTKYLDNDAREGIIVGDEHKFDYRSSVFAGADMYITEVSMRLYKSDYDSIAEKMHTLNAKRREKQPLSEPSAGSTFKRPDGYFAAKLIEDAGLKGFSVGGAQVSQKHAGFVINMGNAKASDVLSLIDYIKETIDKKFGVTLECEVKMLGEF